MNRIVVSSINPGFRLYLNVERGHGKSTFRRVDATLDDRRPAC
jgi:hypothetical protein